MDYQTLVEKKTSNYLKEIAALSICKTNPILRLHYNRESENIATAINESASLKSGINIECKFCYSSSPTVKILTLRNDIEQNRKIKRAITICRVCKHKYPPKMSSKITPRTKYVSSTPKSAHSINVEINQTPKTVEKNKVSKKKKKDVNAGLIIPALSASNSYSQDKRCYDKKQGQISNGNQKLSRILSKMNPTNQELSNKRLDKFFDFNQ